MVIDIFVEKPNLPKGRVSLAAISKNARDIIDELERLSVNTVLSDEIECMSQMERDHADMQLLHLGGDRFVSLKENNSFHIFSKIKVEKNLGHNYPFNILLNCLILSNRIFCKADSVDPAVFKALCCSHKTVNVRQGYTKCSVAVVSDNAIITADSGIYTAAIKEGFDVLKIRSGFIALQGADYGFIGGACGKISKDILAFCGKIEEHPDYLIMKNFAKNQGVDLLSLSNGTLLDIGGILPIMEYSD